MKNSACFECGQKGHWRQDCPLKSSNARPFNNNDSQYAKDIWCRCGHGLCEVKTSKSDKNSGRKYYACPTKRGARCNNGFVKWCDDPVVESDSQPPPPFKYPECQCLAGVCRREKATDNLHGVRYYFACPIKQGHGSCGYKVWEDELLHNESPVRQSFSCKRTLNGFEDDQDDNDLDEGGKLLVNHSKKMRILDISEEPTMMAISEAELSQSEDEALEKASQLSCLSESTPSRISDRQHVFPRHIFAGAGADPSFGFSPLGWLGRLLFSPPQSLKSPSSQSTQSIFCCVFPSFNPIDVPKQASIADEHSQLDAISLSQQTQLSSSCYTELSKDAFSPNKSPNSERKLMSRAQKQRQVAFVAQQQLLIDLVTLEPHEHESMKEAAEDTFALLDNLGANDTQFSEHVWDFINLTSSIAQMTKSIENSLSPEEHNKCLEEEKAKFVHIHNLYEKTEAQFQASDQRRQSLCKEISHFEAILFEKQNQLKSYELETSNIEMELGDLKRNMLEADTALKARTEQPKIASKLREERQAKQIAAKSALEKALLELQY